MVAHGRIYWRIDGDVEPPHPTDETDLERGGTNCGSREARTGPSMVVGTPLADIAPNWRHPVTGRSVAKMLAALPAGELAQIKPLE